MPATSLGLTPWLILTAAAPQNSVQSTFIKPAHVAAAVFAALAALWFKMLSTKAAGETGASIGAAGVAASDKLVGSPVGLLVVPVVNYFLAQYVVPSMKLRAESQAAFGGGAVVCAVCATYCALQGFNTILKFSVSGHIIS